MILNIWNVLLGVGVKSFAVCMFLDPIIEVLSSPISEKGTDSITGERKE